MLIIPLVRVAPQRREKIAGDIAPMATGKVAGSALTYLRNINLNAFEELLRLGTRNSGQIDEIILEVGTGCC